MKVLFMLIAISGTSLVASGFEPEDSVQTCTPYSRDVYGHGYGMNRWSAERDAESDLRYKLNRYSFDCRSQKGTPRHGFVRTYCRQSSKTQFTCDATVSFNCDCNL